MKAKKRYEEQVVDCLGREETELGAQTLESLWELFVAIGRFWRNVDDPAPMRSNFEVFVQNRIRFSPMYLAIYLSAVKVIDELKEELGEEAAYEYLFTNAQANESPPVSALQWTRQYVSNEFVAWQLALGGFKAFGAENYDNGYFGGPNIPGRPAPYRTLRRDREENS